MKSTMWRVLLACLVVLLPIAAGRAAPPTAAEIERERVRVAIAIARARTETAPAAPAASPDPYGVADYNTFLTKVERGIRGVLVVGIADKYVGSYLTHCRVPSGFGDLADGEYDCWMQDGKAVLQPRKEGPSQTATPFPQGAFTVGTIAPPAGLSAAPAPGAGSFAGTTRTAPTITYVPTAGLAGGTNCTSYG